MPETGRPVHRPAGVCRSACPHARTNWTGRTRSAILTGMDATGLGPLGQRVMERLWRDGPGTVGAVLESLNHGSARPLAYTTVMTILTRLLERGIVTREKEGRQYRYTAAFSRAELGAEIGRRELRKLIDRHGASSLAAFAAELGDPDDELAARLRELAGRSERR